MLNRYPQSLDLVLHPSSKAISLTLTKFAQGFMLIMMYGLSLLGQRT